MITADTNIFVYNVDGDDPAKQDASTEILDALAARSAPMVLQVAGEFYSALARQLRRPPWQCAQAARNLLTSFRIIAATRRSTESAGRPSPRRSERQRSRSASSNTARRPASRSQTNRTGRV